MGLIKVTNPKPPADDRTTAPVNRMKLKALDKAKILKAAEVKIIPFTNRKQTGITNIKFLLIAELVSSAVIQDSSLREIRYGQPGGLSKLNLTSSNTQTGMVG